MFFSGLNAIKRSREIEKHKTRIFQKSLTVKIAVLAVLLLLAGLGPVLGADYVWVDSLQVKTTGIDTLFATPWQDLSIRIKDGDGYIKVGSPDTTSWSDRIWFPVEQDELFVLPYKVKRLSAKAASDSVQVYMIGTKNSAQYSGE